MAKWLLIFTFHLLACHKLLADIIGYHDSLRIKAESKNLIVVHFHNWTQGTREARSKMMETDQNPFGKGNTYGYITCIEKVTGKVIFKKPCPALTEIEISNDEKYIVGISKIMLDNPCQLVVFSKNGELIKQRHIASLEAKLLFVEFDWFKKKYSKQYNLLNSMGRIYLDKAYYVDYAAMNMPTRLGKAWDYLSDYSVNNHLSNNFSETVTNYVYWFYEKNPDIKFIYKNSALFSISLLDVKQQRFEIKIKE